MTNERIADALAASRAARAERIADVEYLIEKLNVAWLKGRDLTGLSDATLEALTREMWESARLRRKN